MSLAVALASGVVFLLAFFGLGLVQVSLGALTIQRDALRVLRDPTADDRARELVTRRASLRLLVVLWSIVWRVVLVFFAAALPLLLGDLLGIAPWEQAVFELERWETIIGLTVFGVFLWLVWAKKWSSF